MCSSCYASVKGDGIWSDMFRVDFGVRQGSVLSPYIFALYLDDLSRLCLSSCIIILYSDDILFISPSFCRLEKLLHICEKELHWLDMAINFKKSWCLRIGPRCDTICMNLRSTTGSMLLWVDKIRYLGVHFVPATYRTSNAPSIMPNVPSTGQPTLFLVKLGEQLSKNPYSNSLKQNASMRILSYGLEACLLKKKLILGHSTLSSTVCSWNYLGLITWILSDNVCNFLTLICLVSQLSIEPPTLSQNLLQIVMTCCYCRLINLTSVCFC